MLLQHVHELKNEFAIFSKRGNQIESQNVPRLFLCNEIKIHGRHIRETKYLKSSTPRSKRTYLGYDRYKDNVFCRNIKPEKFANVDNLLTLIKPKRNILKLFL